MSSHSIDAFAHLKKRNNPSLPSGYSSTSSAGYYSKDYAELIRPVLDSLDPETQAIAKRIYTKPYESIHTLYKKLYEGWRWLMEKGEPEERDKYYSLRKMIEIKKRKHYLELMWTSKNSLQPFKTEDVKLNDVDPDSGDSNEDSPRVMGWREQVVEWCTNAPDGVIFEEKHRLSAQEQMWLISYLAEFRSIVIIRLDGFSVKLAKNEKLAAKIRQERGAQG